MNLHDEEWDPPPTEPALLQKVRYAVRSVASDADVTRLRALLLEEGNGRIPHEVRGMVWAHLMGLSVNEDVYSESAEEFIRAALHSVRHYNEQEIICRDVERTRPSLKVFQNELIRSALTRLLSLYCERQRVNYVQGFNELLAPFLLLSDVGGNPRLVYALFATFTNKFAPWLIDGSDGKAFDELKRAFRYFGRLLLYFDPLVHWTLERSSLSPDIYATSWLVTIFARNLSLECTFALWDLLLLEILHADVSELPKTLTQLSLSSAHEVHDLWRLSSALRVDMTPPSFQRLMAARLLDSKRNRPRNASALAAARAMQSAVTLQITAEDLAPGGAIRFFVVDCRPSAQTELGTMAQAAMLCLDALRNADALVASDRKSEVAADVRRLLEFCEPLRDRSHIALLGSGDAPSDSLDVHRIATLLTQAGVPCVSTVRGGFREIYASVMVDKNPYALELINVGPESFALHAEKARGGGHGGVRSGRKATALPGRQAGRHGPRPPFASGVGHGRASTDAGAALGEELVDRTSTAAALARLLRASTNVDPCSLPLVLPGAGRTLWKAAEGGGAQAHDSVVHEGAGLQSDHESDAAGRADLHRTVNSLLGLRGPEDSNTSPVHPPRLGSEPESVDELSGFEDAVKVGEQPAFPNSVAPNPFDNVQPDNDRGYHLPKADKSSDAPSKLGDDPNELDWSPSVQPSRMSSSSVPASSRKLAPTPASSTASPPVTKTLDEAREHWGAAARADWLDAHGLVYPPEGIVKGFTLDVTDQAATYGLALFPCRPAAGCTTFDGRPMKCVGVSTFYVALFVAHASRATVLELAAMRRVSDLQSIALRKSDHELVALRFARAGRQHPAEVFRVCVHERQAQLLQLLKSVRGTPSAQR